MLENVNVCYHFEQVISYGCQWMLSANICEVYQMDTALVGFYFHQHCAVYDVC